MTTQQATAANVTWSFGATISAVGAMAAVAFAAPPAAVALSLYCAGSCGAMVYGYFVSSSSDVPACLQKAPDGHRTLPARLALLPARLASRGIQFAQVLYTSEPAWTLVSPGVYVGRQPWSKADLPSDVTIVLDLTTEFEPAAEVQAAVSQYITLPAMDGTLPPADVLEPVLRDVASRRDAVVYVHCAYGHGRSAVCAALIAFMRLEYPDWRTAMCAFRKLRPRVNFNQTQAQVADAVEQLFVH